MRFVLVTALLASLCARADTPKTDDEKSLYSIGFIVGSRNLQQLSLKPAELKMVQQGISDGATGKKAAIDTEAQGEKLNAFAQARANAGAEKEKTASKDFFDKASKESGAKVFDVDLGGGKKASYVYKQITAGTGASPAASDKVKVDYEGKL